MTSQSTFRLKVRQIDQSCVFDLSSSNGQEISATLKYPERLTELYQNWQQIYRRRYELQARARVGSNSGSGTPTNYDWDQELRIAETALLTEFDYWLGQAELLQIRETIQRSVDSTSRKPSRKGKTAANFVDLWLECNPISLARLPWETWKLASKNAQSNAIRIARTCTAQVPPPTSVKHHRRSKIRILAILAIAPDLNHEFDQKALRSLFSVATIEFIHCGEIAAPTRNGSQSHALKQRIADAIADPRGWDVLFFSGHSDEAAMTGGKLELAPQTTLSISEIEPQLIAAKQRGLQLAVFNSCSGLHIADSLVRLGLPQVVVMREPIQDAVAHKFLEQFCRSLSCYHDVHTAVLETSKYFASENIAYPSAHLIPSLFRHPDPKVSLFRIEPSALKRLWQGWKPTRWEAIVLGTISFCSVVMPLQELLFELRYGSQAVYRQTTRQLPPVVPPVVTLLKIDQASLDRKGIDAYKIKPMSRAYLAELVDRLQQLNVRVIGVDYLLDGSTKEDGALATAVQTAAQQQTWFVFAMRQNDAGQPIQVNSTIAKPDWILKGNIDFIAWNVMLPETLDCRDHCPFAYQLALARLLSVSNGSSQPQLSPLTSLQDQVIQNLNRVHSSNKTLFWLQQPETFLDLQPVIDFSLPPNRVYQSIAAWDFLDRPLDDPTLKALQQQIVIIGSGGYDQADDNFPVPLAIQYWRAAKGQFIEDDQTTRSQVFPGVTTHAYTVHHLLSQHLLLPIPALWMVGIAGILGKGATLLIASLKNHKKRRLVLCMMGGTAVYGLIGLQSYVTAAIVIPWFLPSVLFWLYVLPALRRL
ncbi:CHASE2 domain-containing protein [Phormidesmis priestleyi]